MTLPRTPSQTVGPYFAIGLTQRPQNVVVRDGDVRIIGRVTDGNGEPVSDGMVEIFQPEGWGRCGTDADGRFEFVTARPAGGRPLDVLVFARGLLRHLGTRIYLPGADEDELLRAVPPDARDTLFAVEEDGAYRFDIRLRGDGETVFFAV
jgi:protocatechuate 3,4-dioxygenase, alpha subunit